MTSRFTRREMLKVLGAATASAAVLPMFPAGARAAAAAGKKYVLATFAHACDGRYRAGCLRGEVQGAGRREVRWPSGHPGIPERTARTRA